MLPSPPFIETPKPVIAVAEDDPDIAEMLELLLTMLGTAVVYVPPSQQAITGPSGLHSRL